MCAMQSNPPHVTLSFEIWLADEHTHTHALTHMHTQTAKWHVLFMNEEPALCIVSLMFALAASQRSAPSPLIRQRAASEGGFCVMKRLLSPLNCTPNPAWTRTHTCTYSYRWTTYRIRATVMATHAAHMHLT